MRSRSVSFLVAALLVKIYILLLLLLLLLLPQIYIPLTGYIYLRLPATGLTVFVMTVQPAVTTRGTIKHQGDGFSGRPEF